jgi:hypothetical protein
MGKEGWRGRETKIQKNCMKTRSGVMRAIANHLPDTLAIMQEFYLVL